MPASYPRRKIDDDREPWDQQHKEPNRAFHMFCHYRDLPVQIRSVKRAFVEHRTRCRGQDEAVAKRQVHGAAASSEWGWVERAAAWDRELDKHAREKIKKEQTDAKQRHARIAQASLQVLSMPAYVLIKAAENPDVLARLIRECQSDPKAFIKMLDLASWSGRTMPGLVDVDRMALGLSADTVDVDDKTDDLGFDIPATAEATELASALLDQLADTRTRIAERSSVPGDADGERRSLGTGTPLTLPEPEANQSGAAEDPEADHRIGPETRQK